MMQTHQPHNYVFCYITNKGNYNKLPEPYQESNLDAFWNHLFTWPIAATEFRQVALHGYFRGVLIFYFHDCAFALVQPVKWHSTPDGIKWDEPVRVLRIGCEHDFEVTSLAMCLTHYRCKKCGFEQTLDSSG